ncbi:hypothetical protein SAMN02745133_01821 [Desulforamulus putei DSM 12395]|uniref:Uncharacterized protein n=1 Tax=Desulforamulus putei DSM 12395 TaxID=1121429 RepID=A0A1M4YUN2_9FIRM|nr:hypothetical protein SAMN02745133_01821 [Desulforamulus putei DSM 12395]
MLGTWLGKLYNNIEVVKSETSSTGAQTKKEHSKQTIHGMIFKK